MALTTEQIFAAADEIDAAGLNPTLAAVRKALGSGSFTTIAQAMSEWRARKATRDSPVREPMPETLVERVQEFTATLWAAAIELANRRLDAERDTFETARQQLESEKREAADLADQVNLELETLKATLGAQQAVERAIRADLHTLQSTLTSSCERAIAAEARVAEITRRADDLSAELQRAHQQNAELLRALTAYPEKAQSSVQG